MHGTDIIDKISALSKTKRHTESGRACPLRTDIRPTPGRLVLRHSSNFHRIFIVFELFVVSIDQGSVCGFMWRGSTRIDLALHRLFSALVMSLFSLSL